MAAAYHESCIRGQQVNAELQELREQLATTQHLAEMSRRQVADEAGKVEQLKAQLRDAVEARQKDERDNGMTALRSQNRLGQEALAEELQTWLRPVLELVAEHPEEASPLAVAVLGYLPGIASRLIEE
jgi:small-conductance mechanosensitive channel